MRYSLAIVLLAAAVGVSAWHRASEIEEALEVAVDTAVGTLGGGHITAEVDGLDVVLAGKVETSEAKEGVGQAAAAVPGVRAVINDVSVSGLGDSAAGRAAGAAIVSWDSCQEGLDAVLAAGRIDFASGSAQLDEASIAVIDELVAILRQCGDPRIEIAGHTDASGPRDENLALSQRRAEAVLAYMLTRGGTAQRLTARGYGPDEPLVDNITAAGRARNRRIEFRVLDR